MLNSENQAVTSDSQVTHKLKELKKLIRFAKVVASWLSTNVSEAESRDAQPASQVVSAVRVSEKIGPLAHVRFPLFSTFLASCPAQVQLGYYVLSFVCFPQCTSASNLESQTKSMH